MPTVSYLANRFPAGVEPYVGHEIAELRRRGATVIGSSIRRAELGTHSQSDEAPTICFQPVRWLVLLKAIVLMVKQRGKILPFLKRAVWLGHESPTRRMKATLHTCLGAYYALLLQEYKVEHIHVHHGYFGSWVGMVAAGLLDVGFSFTLHGSDLLIHDAYIDAKIAHSSFCVTISEYNRVYIRKRFPSMDQRKVLVARLGVDADHISGAPSVRRTVRRHGRFSLLSAGRLHAVKNHSFLIRACSHLVDIGMDLQCAIAGDGPERGPLEDLIEKHHLQARVKLLGYVQHLELVSMYRDVDLFVLTSISEGIPLVLMEAMARRTIVLAPNITGIPELVIPGKTGFLYEAGDLKNFVTQLVFIASLLQRSDGRAEQADWIRHAAAVQVRRNFNRQENLRHFADRFLQIISTEDRSKQREDSLLQQI